MIAESKCFEISEHRQSHFDPLLRLPYLLRSVNYCHPIAILTLMYTYCLCLHGFRIAWPSARGAEPSTIRWKNLNTCQKVCGGSRIFRSSGKTSGKPKAHSTAWPHPTSLSFSRAKWTPDSLLSSTFSLSTHKQRIDALLPPPSLPTGPSRDRQQSRVHCRCLLCTDGEVLLSVGPYRALPTSRTSSCLGRRTHVGGSLGRRMKRSRRRPFPLARHARMAVFSSGGIHLGAIQPYYSSARSTHSPSLN